MSVIVKEIKREVKRTEVAGKTYTITLSEQDAALVFYLTGASCGYGARVFQDLLPFFGDVSDLRHNRIGEPAIELSPFTVRALNKLSDKVRA